VTDVRRKCAKFVFSAICGRAKRYVRPVPRKLRLVVPHGVYHVYSRGNDGCEIAFDRYDYEQLEALVLRTTRNFNWRCWAYALMPNHLHLVVELQEANLSAGMQRLLGRYAQLFNETHDRRGHLFQGRFQDRFLATDRRRAAAIAYVLHNPVAAGLATAPELWPYTGGLAADWRVDTRPSTRHAA
jgi:REP element-mobilizing transposase RayT